MTNEIKIKELLIKEIIPNRQYLAQSDTAWSCYYILNDNEEWECDDKSIEQEEVNNVGGFILEGFKILTIGELMPMLFNNSFKEKESGIIYKFINPDTLNINNKPFSKFNIYRSNGELYLKSGIENNPLLIILNDTNLITITLLNKDRNRSIVLFQER